MGRETTILATFGLAGVKQSKTCMLPRETPGLARAEKGTYGLRLQDADLPWEVYTGRASGGGAWGCMLEL